MKKAIVLLSGGLDSATVLAVAKSQGYQIYALSFDYGQRHRTELDAARRLAAQAQVVEHIVLPLNLAQFGGSSLVDASLEVPQAGEQAGIPSTYVPARNTVFLAIALALAEAKQASELFIGVNAVDYSGYPDCRPEFIAAFQAMANLATRAGVEGSGFRVVAPLQQMTKAEIIRLGVDLGVDYAQTVSCYQADQQGKACGHCDSCVLRASGFAQAGVADPTQYW